MKTEYLLKQFRHLALCALAGWALAHSQSSQGAITTNVAVSDGADKDAFTPNAVTINTGDKVTWVWGGSHFHTSTSQASPPVWNSGSLVNPASFSFTFNTAGNYPYVCVIHGFTGSVKVQGAANSPPSVAITSPANGATFAAPWTGKIQATVSDSDGTVSKVQFLTGATSLGTITNPSASPSLTVSNLAAGNYTLKAVATDNQGATNTSAGIAIAVVAPAPIVLSSPMQVSPSAFQFSYSANPGLRYVVSRSGILPALAPIGTNTATSNTVNFLDTSATGAMNFYGVRLLPNP